MQKPWSPPLRWVFGAATLLGLFSTLQAYRLTTLTSSSKRAEVEVWALLVLNFTFWFIPALLAPVIFRLVHRYPLDAQRRKAFCIHALAALVFASVHAAGMLAMRAMLWGAPLVGYPAAWQGLYLTNLDWLLMTYSTVVGFTYALGYYREVQVRAVREAQLQTRLAEARLKTLQAELHPHFLFNTLHAISTLVQTNPDGADRMISRLSDLLRLTLDRSGAPQVTLQEELEFLQKYLEIEQTRFQDRLTVRYDIDPDTLDAEVPRMLLQPLVENAIKHGVSPRSGLGLVEVLSRLEGHRLWVEIRDNGVGLSGNARSQFSNGVGLANTRDRLECLYGDDYRLEFSEGGGGLTVRIALPLTRIPLPAEPAAQVA